MSEAYQQLRIKFSQSLWDQSDIIFKETQQNRNQIKQFLSILESRSKIQLKYSQQLNSLCMDKFENKNNMSAELIKIYVLAVRKRADQAKLLSKFIIEEIISKLKEIVQLNSSDYKKDVNIGRQMQKQFCKIKQVMEKNKSKFAKKKKQYEEAQILNFVMNTCRQYGIQKKLNQREKIKEKQNQFNEISNQLKKSIDQYKQTIKKYEKTTKPILSKLYDIQHKRLQKIIQVVKNLQIMETSYYENLKYDVQENYKFINNAKVERQIDSLILRYSRKSKKSQKIELDSNSFIIQTFIRIENKQFDNLVKYGKNHKLIIQQYFQRKLEQNQENQPIIKICKFFEEYWNGAQVIVNNNQLEQIKSLLTNIYSRKNFLMCMQQLRLTGKFEVNIKSLQIILKILTIFLDNCILDKDSYHAKQIMILTFTYYIFFNQKKIFLYHFLKSNQIWKQNEFWQSAFLEGIYQQFQGYSKQMADIKGSVGHFQRQQNLVFNQLTYYIHNMILFGMSEKNAKILVSKYIKLYNIDEARANELQINISVAIKQKNIQQTNPLIPEIFKKYLLD